MSAPHVQRMKEELEQLRERTTKLADFINGNPVFNTLPHVERLLLEAQLGAMTSYGRILFARIDGAQPQPAPHQPVPGEYEHMLRDTPAVRTAGFFEGFHVIPASGESPIEEGAAIYIGMDLGFRPDAIVTHTALETPEE